MTKPALTVERLLQGGFEEVGCWELNSARDLVHKVDLPTRSGVYAFAINGIAHYVGLASKSLRQRLGFYKKPGASQRTNVRLNEIIRGQIERGTVVQILTAHPPGFGWNGFTISGAEGLEAGLIAAFDLPWNLRGATQSIASSAKPVSAKSRQTGIADRIVELVRKRPGMTELEIAKAIYGRAAVQQQVNQHCRSLLRRRLLIRQGAGGALDPFAYRVVD